ncbi:S8/S53 family peptidase [Kribbella sp. NPDC051952]|uniref:S8 family peptidase n=1 Tax=Kribbella sp. NPDC051952 TaxID=3154851 RepID=UPI0034289931
MTRHANQAPQPGGPYTAQDAQRAVIHEGFERHRVRPRRIGEGRTVGSADGVDFLFEEGTILVREEYFGRVRVVLAELGMLPRDRGRRPFSERGVLPADRDRRDFSEPVIAGVSLVRLDRGNRPSDVLAALDAIRTFVGPNAAAPNLVFSITGNAAGCPAVEPEPMPAGSAPHPGYTSNRCAGEGVKVVVVDTGYDEPATQRSSWLRGVDGDPDYAISGDILSHYAGHGTFIAGVIRCVAPLAEVHVRKVFEFGGAATEADLVRALDQVLECDHPDIISMSAGTYAYDASGPLTFPFFNAHRLSHHKGVVMVVAAGNDDDRKPFWPAAAPYTVSVGALGTHWKGKAGFSNHGGWVDVYAPGQDLVNAFPVGTYTYREPPHVPPFAEKTRVEKFYGMAMWSGTSFSTPLVAGLIAARMSRTGENGRDAAAALIAEAQGAAQPGVGAVLLPE